MDPEKSFLGEMVGKVVWVTTAGGLGTKDAFAGNYKGTLLGFDGQFLKLEHELKRFVNGATIVDKAIIVINASYVRTVEEYREDLNVM
jgi:hypothetical protein